jgi:hypothetical protein
VILILMIFFFNYLNRRGFAAATESATRGGVVSIGNKMGPKKTGEDVVSTYKVSWVPDPVTGYYKPENIKDVDAAELRAKLLQKKLNN